jgi:hypothetical protein
MTQKVNLCGFFCDFSTGECFQIEMNDKEVKDVNPNTTKRDIH